MAQNYMSNGVVKFRADQSSFGARNDRFYKGLGVKSGSRGLFVIILEKAGACL